MIRLVLFIIFVALVSWGAVWVGANPGAVSLNWGGWRIETSVGVLAGITVLFALSVALVYRMWLFITRTPAIMGNAIKQRRSRKGYKALTQGMVAVAAGDAREAARQVKRADGLLGDPPLTLLLKAQSAQLSGDEKAAENFFKAMLENEETEFLGLRGLLGQAIKAGDKQTALEIARAAHEIKPKSEWLADVLFELESNTGHWELAAQSLKQLEKTNLKANGESENLRTRRRAVVAYGRSLEAQNANDNSGKIKWAEKAFNTDNSFAPAAIRLAQIYADENKSRKAMRLVEKAWAINPNPGLLEPYYQAAGAIDGMKKLKAMEKLSRSNPDHGETLLAVAVAALEAKIWGQARSNLGTLMENGSATKRVYVMQAKLEEEENNDTQAAKRWLQMATMAPSDPAWVCSQCGHGEKQYHTHCSRCGGFDSMVWRSAPIVTGLGAVDTNPNNPATLLLVK
ncbi:MAG: heme biosynthesis protein HemY [Rhodospirillaceae bacterium]|nr:heme biosynthesis protein HemY [Rhodospirillaceae bacterium]